MSDASLENTAAAPQKHTKRKRDADNHENAWDLDEDTNADETSPIALETVVFDGAQVLESLQKQKASLIQPPRLVQNAPGAPTVAHVVVRKSTLKRKRTKKKGLSVDAAETATCLVCLEPFETIHIISNHPKEQKNVHLKPWEVHTAVPCPHCGRAEACAAALLENARLDSSGSWPVLRCVLEECKKPWSEDNVAALPETHALRIGLHALRVDALVLLECKALQGSQKIMETTAAAAAFKTTKKDFDASLRALHESIFPQKNTMSAEHWELLKSRTLALRELRKKLDDSVMNKAMVREQWRRLDSEWKSDVHRFFPPSNFDFTSLAMQDGYELCARPECKEIVCVAKNEACVACGARTCQHCHALLLDDVASSAASDAAASPHVCEADAAASPHVCEADAAASWAECLQFTKKCPKCAQRWAKHTIGCNDMHCDRCHCDWRWNTGQRQALLSAENPHSEKWLEELHKQAKAANVAEFVFVASAVRKVDCDLRFLADKPSAFSALRKYCKDNDNFFSAITEALRVYVANTKRATAQNNETLHHSVCEFVRKTHCWDDSTFSVAHLFAACRAASLTAETKLIVEEAKSVFRDAFAHSLSRAAAAAAENEAFETFEFSMEFLSNNESKHANSEAVTEAKCAMLLKAAAQTVHRQDLLVFPFSQLAPSIVLSRKRKEDDAQVQFLCVHFFDESILESYDLQSILYALQYSVASAVDALVLKHFKHLMLYMSGCKEVEGEDAEEELPGIALSHGFRKELLKVPGFSTEFVCKTLQESCKTLREPFVARFQSQAPNRTTWSVLKTQPLSSNSKSVAANENSGQSRALPFPSFRIRNFRTWIGGVAALRLKIDRLRQLFYTYKETCACILQPLVGAPEFEYVSYRDQFDAMVLLQLARQAFNAAAFDIEFCHPNKTPSATNTLVFLLESNTPAFRMQPKDLAATYLEHDRHWMGLFLEGASYPCSKKFDAAIQESSNASALRDFVGSLNELPSDLDAANVWPAASFSESQPPFESETKSQPLLETEIKSQPLLESETNSQPPFESEIKSQPLFETEIKSQQLLESAAESHLQSQPPHPHASVEWVEISGKWILRECVPFRVARGGMYERLGLCI